MLRFSLLCTAFATVGQLALATPPDIADVRDEFLGLSGDNIFIIRSTRDNLGVYDAEQRDVVLVLIDRTTGQETLLPVYSSRTSTNEPTQQNAPMSKSTTAILPKGAVNPYATLQEQSGTALSLAETESGKISESGDAVEVRFSDEPAVKLSKAKLLTQASANLDQLAAQIGDYPRLAPLTLKDLIAGQDFSGAECSFDQPVSIQDFRGKPPARLLRVSCDSEGQILSMLLPVAP